VGSREQMLFDPVTTEAKAEMAFLPQGKSMDAITRRPSEPGVHLGSYISGYVDGEGCFCVSMRPQRRIRVGWEVRPSFSVSQNDDRSEVIRMLPEVFGCGTIRPDRSDRTVKYEVRSLRDLTSRVVPFFERHPLLSSKQTDFEIFRRVCGLMIEGAHLTQDGVVGIADLAARMNSSGVRRYTSEMVRMSFRGEEIVCAPSNGGTT
jgi:hypothetical protein